MQKLFAVLVVIITFSGKIQAEDQLWKSKLLVVDGNEALDFGDVNQDGQIDIVAGRNWYAGPDFIPRPLRSIEDWNGYIQSNCDFVYDVDGDKFPDVVSMSFIPTEINWYKNPGKLGLELGQLWTKQVLVDTKASQNEGSIFQDLDGDGVPELLVNSWNANNPLTAWKFDKAEKEVEKVVDKKKTLVKELVPTMKPLVIGKRGNGHGMAVGDLNGDGKFDILVGSGWYEQPAEKPWEQEWNLHQDWQDLGAPVPAIIHDFNGDGKNDVLLSKAHGYGIYWWEHQGQDESGKIKFQSHEIENFAGAHTFNAFDLNKDGQPEFITGKRFRAHNGGDPGEKEPLSIHYYRWNKEKLGFDKTFISTGGTIGAGLYLRSTDLNQDGFPDIAVAGKSGTYILWNPGK